MMVVIIILSILVFIGVIGFVLYKKFISEKRGILTGYDEIANIDNTFRISTVDLFDKMKSIPEIMHFRAEKHPDRIINIWINSFGEETSRITYLECLKFINGLRRDKFKKLVGKKVLILMAPSLEYNIVFIACLCAGIIAVPVYPPRDYAKSIRTIVGIAKDCGAKHIISTTMIKSKIMIAYLTISKEFKPGEFTWICVPTVEIMKKKYKKKGRNAKLPKDTDLAYLQYTSGSTSSPKGVMITHKNLARQCYLQFVDFLRGEYFIGHTWIPNYHTTGLILGVLSPIISGGCHVLFSTMAFLANPTLWLQVLNRYKCYMTVTPNFGFDLAVARITKEEVKKYPLTQNQYVVCGAEPILPRTVRNFAKKFNFKNFVNGYGLTEATLAVSVTKDGVLTIKRFNTEALEQGRVVPEEDEKKGSELVANGSILHKYGMKYAFVDPETNKECPEDVVGELFLSDETVAIGYYKNPEATKATFNLSFIRKNGENSESTYLRTGDLGFCYDDLLYICGRIKDIIIIRGRNLHPHDIEKDVTDSHEYNAKIGSIAFSVSNYKGIDVEQLVIVSEITQENEKKDLSEVFKAIRHAVTEEFHVIPSYIVLIKAGSLPRTSSHKVARNPCKQMFLKNELDVLGMREYSERVKDE